MSLYWTDERPRRKPMARKREDLPGLAIVLALIAGGLGAGIVMLIGAWVIAEWIA